MTHVKTVCVRTTDIAAQRRAKALRGAGKWLRDPNLSIQINEDPGWNPRIPFWEQPPPLKIKDLTFWPSGNR
jgi:hypothetical protein